MRRLPEADEASELPWVSGLAQWALERKPSDSEFKVEWLALKPLYPRAPQRWRRLIAKLLSATTFRDAEIAPPGWWHVDPEFAPMLRDNFVISDAPLRSPMPQDCDRVIAKLDERFEKVEPLIDELFQQHRRYLNATGDAQYFVRAVHALGRELIERIGDNPHARAHKVQALAREGLKWRPHDRYLWALWRDALVADDAPEAAELIGWEFELWLRASQVTDKEPAIAGLHSSLRPMLRVIEGGRSIKDAFSEARETIISALHDANEAALGETLLAA